MTQEHFCEKHQMRFFSNSDGTFTHKIAGSNPVQYCAEKTLKPATVLTKDSPGTKLPDTTANPPKTIDYERAKRRGVAVSYSKDMVINGFEKPENLESLADRFLRYIEG